MQRHRSVYADYNVFHRKRQPALRCAVRQDRAVPIFIQGETWEFAGTVSVEQRLPGFHPQAAEEAMRHAGYYLFHTLDH